SALALLGLITRASVGVLRMRSTTGAEGLVGHVGVIRRAPAPLGQVFVDGALWRARPCLEDDLEVGDPVVVERVNGLVLSGRGARGVGVRPMTAVAVAVLTLVALAAAVAGTSVRVLREYERAVVFRLGRLVGRKGPGIVLLIPLVDRMVRVDLRTVTFEVPP